MALFQGVSAFPITPADADGVVDAEGVARLVRHLQDAGVGSIGLLGSTGTYVYLSRDERRRAVRAAVDAVGGRTPLLVGIGALRTDEVQALARDAEAEGADALLLAPVSYTPLTEDEVFEHFAAVAAATRLPICVYDNPTTTHFAFTAGLLDRLSDIETIKAVKSPLPSKGSITEDLAAWRARPAGRLSVGYSGDWGMAEALLAGADAFYSVLAGFLPRLALAMETAASAGNRDEVSRLNTNLGPIWALFRELGGLRVAYAAVNELGLCRAELPRPILPVSEHHRREIAKALAALPI